MREKVAGREPELSVRAVGFGLLLGGLLAAGNVYAAIKVAVFDPGMTMLVLVSFALFAALRRPLSALEVNIAQIAGSSAAVMALTGGVIGPVPALAMGGHAPEPLWIALWGVALGVLGTLLAVPFRRQLIEEEALPFPTGQATGELVRSLATAGASSARGRVLVLLAAFAVASVIVLGRDLAGLVPDDILLPLVIAGIPAASLRIGISLSPLVFGVGLLVGLRIALSMLLGGALAWGVLAPELQANGVIDGHDWVSSLKWLVWPAVSLMVAGSFTSLAFRAGHLWRAWSRRRAERGGPGWDWVRAGVALSAAATVLTGWLGFGVHPFIGILALVTAVVFSVIGMRATGETDQTPEGSLGALAQGVVGMTAPGSTLPTLFAGGVSCGATAHSASMMQGFKTGHLLGASPGRMVAAQLFGVSVGAVVAVVAYLLLDRAYGIGSQALPSPIAMSWKVTADMVQGGLRSLPPGASLAAPIAAAAGVLLARLERGHAARFTPSPVAIGIGFIVPFATPAGILLGALLVTVAHRTSRGSAEPYVPSIAAGLITGEALTGLVIAARTVTGLL